MKIHGAWSNEKIQSCWSRAITWIHGLATLDEDPHSLLGCNEKFQILLVESHKLDPMAFRATLDEDP